jgi:hypothetical protein
VLDVTCPLCGTRRARRGCPALGQQICPVCCGTKRLVEIQCPADCPYLATAKEHPAAIAVRRQQRDVTVLLEHARDLNQRQSELFLVLNRFLLQYEPPSLHPLIDDDVADAAAALAGTLETSLRGVIYDHRPAGLPAERLVTALKALIAEAGGHHAGSGFDRDAAVVLRRIEAGARQMRTAEPVNRRPYLDLVSRVLSQTQAGQPEAEAAADAAGGHSRLIVP